MRDGFTRRATVTGLVRASVGPYLDQATGQPAETRAPATVPAANIFVDVPLETAEASVVPDAIFKLVSTSTGLADIRKRTPTRSELLFQAATAGALADAGGSRLVGFRQIGEAAVNRTLESKLSNAVSVKDFGAVGMKRQTIPLRSRPHSKLAAMSLPPPPHHGSPQRSRRIPGFTAPARHRGSIRCSTSSYWRARTPRSSTRRSSPISCSTTSFRYPRSCTR